MKKLIMTFAAAGIAAISFAQEETPAASDAPAVTDGGISAVQEAQDTNVNVPAEFKSAEDILREVMSEKGWEEGWDEEKGRIIVV